MDDPTLITQFSSAAGIVWLIQELKTSKWCAFIHNNSFKINRIVSLIAALASGAAINWNWDSATSSLTITGLTGTAIATFLWHAAQQFIGQEMLYQWVYAPKLALREAAAEVITTQRRAAEKVAAAVEDAKQ